ncbi:hypothetical protein GBF38_019257 [Nibea albiflora]|uniref:Uncharacterized protein n=1 Tax=Nibea albiflora TaxID=240163 RepID=A0ACB7F154_NIBAL|nr:hypothetical protein GBF38_019257 [Nibea albiflora]
MRLKRIYLPRLVEIYYVPQQTVTKWRKRNDINAVEVPLNKAPRRAVRCERVSLKCEARRHSQTADVNYANFFEYRSVFSGFSVDYRQCKSKLVIVRRATSLLSSLTSRANRRYQAHWPAAWLLNVALNKMSQRTWGTSVFM